MVFYVQIEWQEKKDDQELTIWEDNWDDDDMKDDFSKQLRWVFIVMKKSCLQ